MNDWKDNMFPLSAGGVNRTGGVFNGDVGYKCIADGNITVLYKNGDSEVIPNVAGDAYRTVNAQTVTITSGTFHIG